MLKEIHLVHHTHMDIGYTDLPRQALDRHLMHLDEVLTLCEHNENLPAERRHYWTCESALLIRDYMACRSKRHIGRLLHALRQGWIELQACLTQPLTELASAEELIQCMGYAAQLGNRESFPVECAMIDDIGGYAGRLPTVLAGWGVNYLVAGVGGFQVHLPWANLPHLFYLGAKDGSRTLVWNLGIDRRSVPQQAGYIEAVYALGTVYLVIPYHHRLMGKLPYGLEMDDYLAEACKDPKAHFSKLLRRLEAEGYPYEELMLQCALDNTGPDPDLPSLVSAINETGELPPIRLTTPRHFFRHVEQKYGAGIPALDGVMADPWITRANPTPSSLKVFREAQRLLSSAQARLAVQPSVAPDATEDTLTREVYDNLLLYSDHTCGLDEWHWQRRFDDGSGCRGSAFDDYRRAWQRKRRYAEAALDGAARLDRLARHRASSELRTASPSIVVWNDRPREMSGPAELYVGNAGFAIKAIVDPDNGQDVSFQRLGKNSYLVFADNVPAMGHRVLKPVITPDSGEIKSAGPFTAEMENALIRLTFDPVSGKLVSVIDKRSGSELLDASSSHGLGDFVYHRIHGVSPGSEQAGMSKDWRFEEIDTHRVSVRPSMNGPVAQSVIAQEQLDGPSGTIRITRETVLYRHQPRVDLRIRLDKPETDKKECCYIAFPFVGKNGAFRYDQNIGWVSPEEDLIPGAMQDAFYCNSWVNVSGDGISATIACPDAPIFQLGGTRTGAWDDAFPFSANSNHGYGWLYHNLINTDTPIWQDILDQFTYGIVFHDSPSFSAADSAKAADEVSRPLRAQMVGSNMDGPIEASAKALLEVGPKSVGLVSVQRTGPGCIRLRIQETAGNHTRAEIVFAQPVERAWTEDFFGSQRASLSVVNAARLQLQLPPHAMVTVGIEYA